MPKNFFKAIAVLLGYVIGVGMFGLPYLITRSGVAVFFVFLVGLCFIQHFLHLIYANIILVTKEYHQLPGYAGIYLGPAWKRIAATVKLLGDLGGLLAYVIITSIFLHELLSPVFGGSELFYATGLFGVSALVLFFGISMMAGVELVMTVFLLLVVLMLFFRGLPFIDTGHYIVADWRYLLLPYGAMLMALDGGGAIPIVVQLLRRNKDGIRRVIRIGTIIPAVIIAIFVLTVVGITGVETTPDALTGLRSSFHNGVLTLALVFGIVSMFTSILGVSESAQEALCRDFNVPKRLGWALVVGLPFLLYVLGFKNLINTISLVGGVAGGSCAIILILIFAKLKTIKGGLVIFKRPIRSAAVYSLILLFVLGIIYEIGNFVN